jgi:catechol 2,3-dioxygenase-like lactoylglutathione lyase family enzyme
MTLLKSPNPLMGIVSAITISTSDLDRSVSFYRHLGFAEIMRNNFPSPMVQLTDGALILLLRQDKDPYLALTYFSKNPDKIAEKLEASGIFFLKKPTKTDFIKRYLFQSPDGLNVSIVTYNDCFQQPKGHTMLTMPSGDYFNTKKYSNPVCGMFGELAHPVKDLELSLAFWKKLGFIVLSEFDSPYPWAILSDGLSIVGLHASGHFAYPAITFYSAKTGDKIQKLNDNGINSFYSAGGESIVLKTPEGQYFNLFQLGK